MPPFCKIYHLLYGGLINSVCLWILIKPIIFFKLFAISPIRSVPVVCFSGSHHRITIKPTTWLYTSALSVAIKILSTPFTFELLHKPIEPWVCQIMVKWLYLEASKKQALQVWQHKFSIYFFYISFLPGIWNPGHPMILLCPSESKWCLCHFGRFHPECDQSLLRNCSFQHWIVQLNYTVNGCCIV